MASDGYRYVHLLWVSDMAAIEDEIRDTNHPADNATFSHQPLNHPTCFSHCCSQILNQKQFPGR